MTKSLVSLFLRHVFSFLNSGTSRHKRSVHINKGHQTFCQQTVYSSKWPVKITADLTFQILLSEMALLISLASLNWEGVKCSIGLTSSPLVLVRCLLSLLSGSSLTSPAVPAPAEVGVCPVPWSTNPFSPPSLVFTAALVSDWICVKLVRRTNTFGDRSMQQSCDNWRRRVIRLSAGVSAKQKKQSNIAGCGSIALSEKEDSSNKIDISAHNRCKS